MRIMPPKIPGKKQGSSFVAATAGGLSKSHHDDHKSTHDDSHFKDVSDLKQRPITPALNSDDAGSGTDLTTTLSSLTAQLTIITDAIKDLNDKHADQASEIKQLKSSQQHNVPLAPSPTPTQPTIVNQFNQNRFSIAVASNTKIKFLDMENYLKDRPLRDDSAIAMEELYSGICRSINYGFATQLNTVRCAS